MPPSRHGVHEWARDDDGDGRREVHCNTCEGAGAALRTYLRAFRGVHKQYLHLYVATYEAMVNTKRVTPTADPTDVRSATSQRTLATHEPKFLIKPSHNLKNDPFFCDNALLS